MRQKIRPTPCLRSNLYNPCANNGHDWNTDNRIGGPHGYYTDFHKMRSKKTVLIRVCEAIRIIRVLIMDTIGTRTTASAARILHRFSKNETKIFRVCEAIRIIRVLIIVTIGTRIPASADRTHTTRICIK